MSRAGARTVLAAAGATVLLTAASVTALALAGPGAPGSPGIMRAGMQGSGMPGSGMPGAGMSRAAAGSSCTVPAALPGRRVTVVLADMGAGMSQRMGPGGLMAGPMMLHALPSRAPAGTLTLVAYNHGSRTHELVVLPLDAGAASGTRTVAADGTVAESGSLGEASRSCGAGGGEGIASGSAGWLTLTLRPGRYELVCNLPGHYAAGMHAELDVVQVLG